MSLTMKENYLRVMRGEIPEYLPAPYIERLTCIPEEDQLTLAGLGGAEVIEMIRNTELNTLTPIEALSLILQQTVMPSDKKDMTALLDMLGRMMESVPMYRLNCNISDEAVMTIHNKIYG